MAGITWTTVIFMISTISVTTGSDYIVFDKSSSIPSTLAAKAQYHIGSLYFTLFESVTVAELASLGELYGEHVSLNDPVHASQSCQEQATGTKYWGLTRIARRQGPPINESDGYSYNQLENGENVIIFIVDSGVEIHHSAFSSRATHGMTASLLKALEGDEDNNGHGTHVAGLAAGYPYGVARNSEVVAVKVLNAAGSGVVNWILEGFEWIAQNQPEAGVINLSLGLSGSNDALDAAVQEMVELGLTVVAAAGNDAVDACTSSPALSPYAITVGATDIADQLTDFSNYGRCVDILAPGADMLSSIPGNDSFSLYGTSMAAPLVAGVAASILSRNLQYAPWQIREILIETATAGAIGNADEFDTVDKLLHTCDACVNCDDYGYIPVGTGNQPHVNTLSLIATLYMAMTFL